MPILPENSNGVQRWILIVSLGFTLFVAAISVSSQLFRNTDAADRLQKTTDWLVLSVNKLSTDMEVVKNTAAYNSADVKQLKDDISAIRAATASVVASQNELSYEVKELTIQLQQNGDGRRH